MHRHKVNVAIVSALLLSIASTARADFLVTLDTSPLSGPHVVGFGLTNFDGASNTVSLTEFDFGGGSAVAGSEDCTLGGLFIGLGCMGSLTGSVTLEDLDVVAFFTEQFNPGASLSFVMSTTSNAAGGTPDQFAMFICDVTFNCYSDDASGAMLLLDLAGGSLSPSSFIPIGASAQNLDAPIVTAVPEPGTLLLLGMAAAGLQYRGRRIRSGPGDSPSDPRSARRGVGIRHGPAA